MVMLHDISEEFYLPLSGTENDELMILLGWIDQMVLAEVGRGMNGNAPRVFIQLADFAYPYMIILLFPHSMNGYIWKSKCIIKIKMLAWLLLSDRLNTKDTIQRRHWKVIDDYNCVLCPKIHDDRDHLFFNCNVTARIWNYLQIQWGTIGSMVQTGDVARRNFRHHVFKEVVALACWNIWIFRNAKIFDHILQR
jgi:hypothetical protein